MEQLGLDWRTYQVRMGSSKDKGTREVHIPHDNGAFDDDVEGTLETIFYYGQNDVLLSPNRSVCIGDVIILNGYGYEIKPIGFRRIP